MSIDLLVINPGAAHGITGGHAIYGDLGERLIAVEQPQWCRILADYARDEGYAVKIIDAEALQMAPEQVAELVREHNPLLVCIAVYGHQPSASTQQMHAAGLIAQAIKAKSAWYRIIMVGGHVAALPERTLQEEAIDYACNGEGPETVVNLLQYMTNGIQLQEVPGLVWWCGTVIVNNKPAALLDINELHGDAWDLLPMHLYRAHNWQCLDGSARQPYASIYTSLGCPYSCLAGDTVVNTLYGSIPIKELAEKFGDAGIPVYTYDPRTRKTFIADGVKVRKYGTNKQLVRVVFDDGTHIDCTPDHEFLQFGWGNGRAKSRKWQIKCRADELPNGAHVRAIRFEPYPTGRVYVTWGRRDRQYRSRMVMEYLLGRRLRRSEHVHHVDHDVSNDHPSNLLYCRSAKEHTQLHPEVAERMRANNPTKDGMSPEWRAKLAEANRGRVRNHISRLRYRASKLGRKNPNYKHGKRTGTASRVEVNHRVVSVSLIGERADVYCLTVPATGWFYANNVLVKNCSFCCINAPFASHHYRMREPDQVVDEIEMLHNDYHVNTIKITDEMFVLNPRHYTAICEGLIDRGLGDELNLWAYARVDTVRPDRLNLLRRAGVRWLALGIESASTYVLDGADKRLKPRDIADVVAAIERAGINVIANYIFGLPDDTRESMRETYDLAARLNTAWANFYCAMAYPGSKLYDTAVKEHWTLPAEWRGYSQHNEYSRPLDSNHVPARDVLAFRDQAFHDYFSRPDYYSKIFGLFGLQAVDQVMEMLEYKLKRNLLAA
jgi:radical SAM superfamily enzyme YgiQ (UPF0313 family)